MTRERSKVGKQGHTTSAGAGMPVVSSHRRSPPTERAVAFHVQLVARRRHRNVRLSFTAMNLIIPERVGEHFTDSRSNPENRPKPVQLWLDPVATEAPVG